MFMRIISVLLSVQICVMVDNYTNIVRAGYRTSDIPAIKVKPYVDEQCHRRAVTTVHSSLYTQICQVAISVVCSVYSPGLDIGLIHALATHHWTCGQCCPTQLFNLQFPMSHCVVESNIVIGLYVLDMWSVLCVPYVGGGSNIVIGLYILDMWSVLCVPCMWVVGSNIVIGLYILDMWSVLCVPYVGGGTYWI